MGGRGWEEGRIKMEVEKGPYLRGAWVNSGSYEAAVGRVPYLDVKIFLTK